jgi:hypothetical protein
MQRKRNRDCATKVRLTSAHWIGTVEAGGRAQRGAGGWPDGSGSRGQWWPDGSVSNGGLEQWRPVALRHDTTEPGRPARWTGGCARVSTHHSTAAQGGGCVGAPTARRGR